MKELTAIQMQLFRMQDTKYRDFQAGLVPGLPEELIGVRVPQIRALARTLCGTAEAARFLSALPHRFYEENLLHAILLSKEKDFARLLSELDAFLPYVSNWAVCDALSPKVFAKYPQEVLDAIQGWLSSGKNYTIRFAIDMLMQFYLGAQFAPAQLDWIANIRSDEHYVNMARAWYFATALAKQEASTLPILLENRLDVWTHNKTIQKAIESYRIRPERKALLRTKKR